MACGGIKRGDDGLAAPVMVKSWPGDGDCLSISFFPRRFLRAWTTHSKPSSWHFVQGTPVLSTSQRILRVRQHEQAFEARFFFLLTRWMVAGDTDCSSEWVIFSRRGSRCLSLSVSCLSRRKWMDFHGTDDGSRLDGTKAPKQW